MSAGTYNVDQVLHGIGFLSEPAIHKGYSGVLLGKLDKLWKS